MIEKPYLLLDAGGTLVFVDADHLSRVADVQGFPIPAQRLHDEHFRLVHWFDTYVSIHRRFPPRLTKPYSQLLLEAAGLPEDAAERVASASEVALEGRSLWTLTFAWTEQTLHRMTDEGYRMSIISNADGRAEHHLREVGLRGFFDRVYDSEIVGSSKPDPGMFELALQDLGLDPGDALYVGDIHFVDVWGANRTGIPALHLDPLGLYRGWPGEHIQDLRCLPDWLQGYLEAPERYETQPLLGFTLEPGPA
jgi:putative hydrolase of the HAD superfamily